MNDWKKHTFGRLRQREACALVVWWPLPSYPCMLYSSDRPSFGSRRVILALNYCLPTPLIHRQWCTTKTSFCVSFLIFRVFFLFFLFFLWWACLHAGCRLCGETIRNVCVCCMFFVCYACIIPFWVLPQQTCFCDQRPHLCLGSLICSVCVFVCLCIVHVCVCSMFLRWYLLFCLSLHPCVCAWMVVLVLIKVLILF